MHDRSSSIFGISKCEPELFSSMAERLAYVPNIIRQKPLITINCAKFRSVVSFLIIFLKQAAGNIMQIATPMVEPTRPMTSSTDGIIKAIHKEKMTMKTVMALNLDSGI